MVWCRGQRAEVRNMSNRCSDDIKIYDVVKVDKVRISKQIYKTLNEEKSDSFKSRHFALKGDKYKVYRDVK